jgi:lysophospholipase L1-like esterase
MISAYQLTKYSVHTMQNSRISLMSLFIAFVANVLLFFSLLQLRATRIVGFDVPFFSLEFIGLFIGACGLIGFSVWALLKNRAQNHVQQHKLLGVGWIIMALVLAFVPPMLFAFLVAYWSAFSLWFLLSVVMVVLWFISPLLEKIQWQALWNTLAPTLIGLLVTFMLIEGGMRLYFTFFGTEADRMNYLYSVDDVVNRYNRFNGQAYVNFGLSPNHPDHNSRGYREIEELTTPKPISTFRIFAIGGSTTYGIDLPNEHAYPQMLERILHERGYTHIEVINGGVPLYATYDNLVNFQFRILDDVPDMVITYEGINDVVTRFVDPAYYNGLNPFRGYWNTANLQQSPLTSVRFFTQRLGFAPTLTNLDSALFNSSNIRRCPEVRTCALANTTPEQVLQANPPIYFERNLRNLVAIANANGVQVVMSTWASYPEPVNGQVFVSQEYVQNAVAEQNDITRQLTQELELPLIDLAESMPLGEQYWLDGLHMTLAGTTEQATQYADFLIENNLLPPPNN